MMGAVTHDFAVNKYLHTVASVGFLLTLNYDALNHELKINLILRYYKSYCSTVHFRRITSISQPPNAHIISHKTLLKHFKTL